MKSISDFARLVSRVEHPHKPLKFITALPEGYETSDDEDGGAVSEPHRSGSLGDHEELLGGGDGGNFGVGFSSTDDADYEVSIYECFSPCIWLGENKSCTCLTHVT